MSKGKPPGTRAAENGPQSEKSALPLCQRPGCTYRTDRPRQKFCWVHFSEWRSNRGLSLPRCRNCDWPTPKNQLHLGECLTCSPYDPLHDPDRAWKDREDPM